MSSPIHALPINEMIYTRDKIFIDTNILVYLFSSSEPEKSERIKNFLKPSALKNRFVWSTQVIQEFYVVMTKKMGNDPQRVKDALKLFDHFELQVNHLSQIHEAIEIEQRFQLSFWDSLILSSAQSSKCTILLSEDFNHDQQYHSLKVVNPFKIPPFL